MTATSDRQDQTTTDCDDHTITDGRIVETTASLGCLGRAFAQVHQVDQAWLPSLMHSFVGHGSVREPYPPALKRQFTRRGRHVPACTHAHTHTHTRARTTMAAGRMMYNYNNMWPHLVTDTSKAISLTHANVVSLKPTSFRFGWGIQWGTCLQVPAALM